MDNEVSLEKEIAMLEEKILQYDATIALCYLYRAKRKGSKAGFTDCIAAAKEFIPGGMNLQDAWLGNQAPVDIEIDKMKKFLPVEMFERASNDIPTIEKLIGEEKQLVKQLHDLKWGD